MTRAAYYALHYGIEYLEWSVRSVADVVDVVCIAYSAKPTAGARDGGPLPANEDAQSLLAAARRGVEGRNVELVWRDVQEQRFREYARHCDFAQRLCEDAGASVAVNVDADEVWDPETLTRAFEIVEKKTPSVRRYTVDFVHLWRSFNYVCYDSSHPIRVHDLRVPPSDELEHLYLPLPVFHFGYAQCEATMKYKWGIHGHRRELRPHWLRNIFLTWGPGVTDVHPTVPDFWNPEPVRGYASLLERMLEGHPYLGLDTIR